VSLALEIRQVSNEVARDAARLDLANRLLHLASRVGRSELRRDDLVAHYAQAERVDNPPPRRLFKLRIVP